jgi:Dolichyl-phosphate-mannose-protein mannosyltransferase
MTRGRGWRTAAAAFLGVGAFVLYAASIDRVPFHPDESSWIHMSREFGLFVHLDFRHMVWWAGDLPSGDVGYRLLDAPLPKYQIGLARWLSGHPEEPNANWIWPISWQKNVEAGTMPSPAVLHAARLSGAAAAALSFILFFRVATVAIGAFPAAGATLLLAAHPLELLHARRAMAESSEQLFAMVAMLAILRLATSAPGPYPRRFRFSVVVVGIALGLAVSAKQNAVALAPLAALAAVAGAMLPPAPIRRRLTAAALQAAALVVSSGLTFFAVNPVMYSQPLSVARRMVSIRHNLVNNQASDAGNIAAGIVLPDRLSRVSAIYHEVFWRPANTDETSTYPETLPSAEAYSRRPLARLWDQTWLRLAVLWLATVGFGVSLHTIVYHRFRPRTWALQIVVLWFFAETAFVVALIPLDWQRYFLPLLPPVCLFAALGGSWVIDRLVLRREGSHASVA